MKGVTAVLTEMLGPEVRVRVGDPRAGDPDTLAPEEAKHVDGAVEPRRRTFAAGRALARALLAELGVAEAVLPVGPRGAPQWPVGVVGSISHAAGLVAVAVAPARSIRTLGIDLEEDTALAEDLWTTTCTPAERRWLATQPAPARGRLAKAIFSAKEAVYKAQFPVTGEFLELDAVEIELDRSGGRFVARFAVAAGEIAVGTSWSGRTALADGVVATSVVRGRVL